MCGFVGRIKRSDRARPDLMAALPFLTGRGPDGWRAWRSPCGRIELLHARLAVVDPEPRGSQPFINADGQSVLTFNGEIYNYKQLRAQLPDVRWTTQTDTEVLASGLQHEGIEFLSRARGMFSGVWVDLQAQRIALFRDPIGKKPLLVRIDSDGALIFGSSLRALMALSGDAPKPRIEALHEVLSEGFIEPPQSLYEDVAHVFPGEVHHYDFGSRSLGKTTYEMRGKLIYAGESHIEVVANVGMLLQSAVATRLDNTPFPSTLLSGGIDSTVVSMAANDWCKASDQKLRAFSLRPVVPGTQDGPYAAEAARRMGVSLQWVSIPLTGVADRVLGALDALDEPLAMPSYFLLYELIRAVRPYSRVLLSGDGGDEVFLGYGTPRDWSATKSTPATSGVRVGPTVPDWFGDWARRVSGTTLFAHMFAKADRASAEQGVELRSPLLDYDLVAYARSLPATELLHDGRMKALLKAQLPAWPERFLERPKIGFAHNLRWSWLLSGFSGLRENVDDTVHDMVSDVLPTTLQKRPSQWRHRDIMKSFSTAYSLLTLSRVLRRRTATVDQSGIQ